MKIGQVAPLMESVPPRLYGGTERIVSYLTEELVRMGHEVTLFASGDSITSAQLVGCVPTAIRLDANIHNSIPYYMLMLDRVRDAAEDFRHSPLPYRPVSFPSVQVDGQSDGHDAAWPARPPGPQATVSRLSRDAANLDL